jgi:hypothetical protein
MNWKSILFDDNPSSQTAPPAKPTGPVSQSSAPVPQITSSLPVAAINADAPASAGFVDILRTHFPESPFHPQIQEFTEVLESLADSIPEEGGRFRAALKVVEKRAKITVDQLTGAYQSYSAILDQQAQKFKASLDQFQSSEITGREEQIKQINSQIEAKNLEIKALMDSRDGIAVDKMNAQNKMTSTQLGFDASITILTNEINDRVNKIKLYLPVAVPPATK